jgi:adenylate cyclase
MDQSMDRPRPRPDLARSSADGPTGVAIRPIASRAGQTTRHRLRDIVRRMVRRISYRVSLVLVIPLLVLATGGTIAWRTFTTTRSTVDALADDLFRNVSEQAVNQARALMSRAVPAVELAADNAGHALSVADQEASFRALLAILRANPEFSWVSYSTAEGAFLGAYRTQEGALRLNTSAIEDGKTRLVEYDVADEGARTLHREDPDTGYDPRTRPFYTLAQASGQRVWTPPYVFFDQGVPGITCARPYVEGGALKGVATVDFDLNSLSRFVAGLTLSRRGRVFIFADEGAVIAHPTVHLVEQRGLGAEGTLVALADIDDPVVKAYEAARREGTFSFEHGGERWRAAATPFAVDENLRWIVGAVAPESDFMAGVQRNNLISLLVSLAALVVAIVLAWLLSTHVARPLTKLASQMDEVGRFELIDRAPQRTVFAEIAMMDGALRRMKSGLRSFASYVPRDVVRAMLASGKEAVLQGEVKELTVFFSDVASFTSIAETMSPEALVHLLAGYFDEATRVIASKQGTVDKFIGDGIMAFWGAPADDAEHATHACQAAILYQRRIAAMKAAGEPWAQHLAARIGISTGPALVGNIGSSERLNYTVMGDTVNVAARLEGLGKVYGVGVLVAEATLQMTRGSVLARPIDVVAVKGKAQGTRVYELLAFASEPAGDERRLVALSEAALGAYAARDFAGAIAAWQEVLALRPADRAAHVMIERAQSYARTPPPADWSGVFVATEK